MAWSAMHAAGLHLQSKHPALFPVTVLSGTKYNLKQARGRFGLGAKMVRRLTLPALYRTCMN